MLFKALFLAGLAAHHVAAQSSTTITSPAEPAGSVVSVASSSIPSEAPGAGNSSVNGQSKFQWQIWKACPDDHKAKVVQAWEDSKFLSDALASWVPKGDYQPAMDMYMGSRSTFQDPFNDYDFLSQIQNTIHRHQDLYAGKSSYGNTRLWVYCNEESFWWKHCAVTDKGAIIAYESEATFTNDWYITFCPTFYEDMYRPLAEVMENVNEGQRAIMESYAGRNSPSAHVFFHESFHMSQLVTSPQALDSAYGAENVYDLARQRNTDAAVYNADSWALTGMANYVQKRWNLDDPPTPWKYRPQSLSAAPEPPANVTTDAPAFDVLYVDTEAVTPQGVSSVPGQDPVIDTAVWSIYTPPVTTTTAPTTTPAPAITPTTAPAYATGTCCFHLDEYQNCNSDSNNLYANITLVDNNKNTIYQTPGQFLDNGGLGDPINAGDHTVIQGPLPQALQITGEHENDYVQFTYGSLSWTSRDTSGSGNCANGGWNPKQGPDCTFDTTAYAENQMDCCFPC